MVYEGIIMVLAAGIGALGSIATGSIGAVSNSHSAKKQFEYQKQLQEQAARLNYNYSLKYAENSPSSTRKGLENANYNPMLAVQNGMSNATSFSGTGSAGTYDNSGVIGSIGSNVVDALRLKNETAQSDSSADANYANADYLKTQKALLIEKMPYVGKQAKADYIKTAMEGAKLENDIHYQNEYLNYLDKSLEVQQRLGELGFANARDVAGINASASRYSADRGYAAAALTPSKAIVDKIGSIYNATGRPKTPYQLGVGLARYYRQNRK